MPSAPRSLQKPLLVHRVWVLISKCHPNLSSIHPLTPKRIHPLGRAKGSPPAHCPLPAARCPLKAFPLKRACPPLAAEVVLLTLTSDVVSSHSELED